MATDQPSQFVDANVLRVTRLLRLFVEQVELMQRLRGKTGLQRLVVEQVNVHEGCQAIVGMVGGKPNGAYNPILGPQFRFPLEVMTTSLPRKKGELPTSPACRTLRGFRIASIVSGCQLSSAVHSPIQGEWRRDYRKYAIHV
jgi:hypothetical protein